MAGQRGARVERETRLGRLAIHVGVQLRLETPFRGVQQSWEERREANAVQRRGFEQARETIQGDRVPGVATI